MPLNEPAGFKYRPEIDGLRAIAVLPVILFHAGFEMFSGGYVGVDVFFVISGYLITGIIYREIRLGTFSIVNFYERRMRRIMPALLFISAACLPFAWAWMLPSELKDYSQSLVAVNLFASNFLFWQESGYFEADVELKPLLHTWSLAVEEQFYILFPLFMLMVCRFTQAAVLVSVSFVIFASIGLAEWTAKTYPVANFYLLPTRAWELAAGAFLAITAPTWAKINGTPARVLSAVGLSMIGYAVFTFDDSIPFPSFWALIPVAGTALVIAFSHSQSTVHKILSLPPIVGVGLISYSAYLWHQPIFAFARIRFPYETISHLQYLILSFAALVLACLTWYFVEQPFRNKTLISRNQIFFGAAIVSGSILAIGLTGHFTSGIPSRHDNRYLLKMLNQEFRLNYGLSSECEDSFTLSPDCQTSENPEIIVWGDSYAMHLVNGIIASNPEVSLIQATKSACAPYPGVAPIKFPTYNEEWAEGCFEFNRAVRGWIETNDSVKFAVISTPLGSVLNNGTNVYHEGKLIKADKDLIFDQLVSTMDWLVGQGIKPVFFAPPPNSGKDISLCLARSAWIGFNAEKCAIRKIDHLEKNSVVIEFLKRVEDRYPVVWISDFLCDGTHCKTERSNVYLYRDAGHLSLNGSSFVGKEMNFYGLITRGSTQIPGNPRPKPSSPTELSPLR